MTIQTSGGSSTDTTRRKFLGFGILTAAVTVAAPLVKPACAAMFSGRDERMEGARRISFRNSHTGEIFSGVYRVGDKYLPDAFDRINIVLRDFRSNELFPIDPRVIDIIYTVHQRTGRTDPYEVISGYRCPKTNANLRRSSEGVAKNSLHMTGQAIDLRLPGFATREVRNIAVNLKAGGVGYYAKSNFVHMDTGDVRSW